MERRDFIVKTGTVMTATTISLQTDKKRNHFKGFGQS